jgi:hypothetical protein
MSLIPNGQYLNGSPASGVIQGAEQAPITDLDGRAGWLFVKAITGTAKFNYFMYGEGSQPVTLGEIKNIYANISNDYYLGANSNPFFVIHTKPTGSGDAEPWYHSALTYSIPATWNVQSGEMITIHTNVMEEDFGYRKCRTSDRTLIGEGLPGEEILYISIHTDSAAPALTQVLVSEVGYKTNHSLQPLDRRIKFISA